MASQSELEEKAKEILARYYEPDSVRRIMEIYKQNVNKNRRAGQSTKETQDA